MGDSLLGDPAMAIELLLDIGGPKDPRGPPRRRWRGRVGYRERRGGPPLTPPEVYAVLSAVRPPDAVIVNESTSTMAQQIEWLPTVRTGSFFATASGGIGWGVPAAVGVALGDRARGVQRPILGLIGDGSFHTRCRRSGRRPGTGCRSCTWSCATTSTPLPAVVRRTGGNAGRSELDLPGLGIASVARDSVPPVEAETTQELEQAFKTALTADTTTVIVVSTQPQKAML